MSISRRTALKQFLFLAGGVALIPSCMQLDESKASLPLRHLSVTGQDEKMLAELAETLIPATSTPGAKDLYLHQFALTMVDDCYSKEDREAFEKGMKSFGKFSRSEMKDSFTALAAPQRAELLQRLEANKDVPEEVANFYKQLKNLAIQGYLTSKHYLTKVQVYELVPGRYHGCVPVQANGNPSLKPV
jgi:hypothetical protein